MGENKREPDFTGWATKNNVVCEDGKTISHGAFAAMDKRKVPLVWMHNHKDNEMVLGHVILEHRTEGTYAEAFFNGTVKGKAAREQVIHGDIDMMSIWANDLDLRKNEVMHGTIREVSLVLSGANREALIEQVYIRHGADIDETDEAIITTGLTFLSHASEESDATDSSDAEASTEDSKAKETVEDVFNGLDDKTKNVVIGLMNDSYESGKKAGTEDSEESNDENKTNDDEKIVEHSATEGTDATEGVDTAGTVVIEHSNMEGNSNVTDHNAFEKNAIKGQEDGRLVLAHDAMKVIMADAVEMKSLSGSILKHAGTYGIDNIGVLFPDAKNLDSAPQILGRETGWVAGVLAAVRKQPWAKVKSIVADLTADEARAKGYITGTEKQDEVISLLRRTTSPKTIYKKQRLDRDDILDITDFDVLVWIKWEMRYMLNEEIARAILIGDGRATNHPDKIKDPAGAVDGIGIRSILHDNALYTIKKELPANVDPETVVEEWIRQRANYRGSGSPTLYTSDGSISDVLLLKDRMGRFLYETERQLADKLRVKEIVPVEVFAQEPTVLGIMVNLVDYTMGTDKGGDITFFSDFDLDFNQEKFLLETRPSGGLTVPKSAIVLTRQQGTLATPAGPSFDGPTNKITIPGTTGIEYRIDGDAVAAGNVTITENTTVTAHAKAGYYIPSNSTVSWTFAFTAG